MSATTGAGAGSDRGSSSPFAPWTATREGSLTSRRQIPLAPDEGWLTVVLVIVLVMPVAWSIADARWVLGDQSLTRFLPWTIVGGAAWGMIGAKVGWGRWTTHLLGAVMAAILVPIFVGSIIVAGPGSPSIWFHATSDAAVEAVLDFTVRNRTVTQFYGHHLLILGLICWGTAQFAGFATLGHRRPLGAVFIVGLVLLTDMTITNRDQMTFLVVFSIAALVLLVRVHADDERASWLQRRIGDPATVTGLYLRGGAAFVAIAVAGSLILTSSASSAPLAGVFNGLNDKLIDFGQQIQRFLPLGGSGTRFSGVSFGPQATIVGRWDNKQDPALTIRVPIGDTTPYYWKAVAYDTFVVPNSWTLAKQNVAYPVSASTPILKGTGDEVAMPELRNTVTFQVTRLGYAGKTVFAPDAVATVDQSTNLTVVGSGGHFGQLDTIDSWSTYTATALVPRNGNDGFTANKLRAASVDYPADIRGTYLQTPPTGAFGPNSTRLANQFKQVALTDCVERNQKQTDPAVFCAANAYDPYDLAEAAKNVLRSSEFRYDTDVTGLNCSGLSTVECFAEFKRGYCQYYATTMAMILRELGVPTRMVEGWLPGTRDPRTGIEQILLSNSHAWVEVYFPGYGWSAFDPTGNGQTQPLAFIPGPSIAPASPGAASPRPSGSGKVFEPPDRTFRVPVTGVITTPPAPSNGPFIVVAILLIFAVSLLAFVAYQRGPRGPTQPETAWAAMIRLAGRFGWAPRPTQTPYEYAGTLGDILPIARSDVHVVAAAKVEVLYGRKTLDAERLSALRTAQRKLRVTLLRLVFRRPKRGSRVRRI
jgi:transglutaminase-like putative cysteine protease